MRYFLVQYVGKAEPRHDNILPRSHRVWERTGSVLRVPEDEALHYLVYDSVWQLAKPSTVDHAQIEALGEPAEFDLLLGWARLLTAERRQALIDALTADAQVPTEDEPPLVPDLADSEACAKVTRRVHDMAAAIGNLDPLDGDAFTGPNRTPKLQRIREMSGIKDATNRELKAAIALAAQRA